jgi:hypothetical protein
MQFTLFGVYAAKSGNKCTLRKLLDEGRFCDGEQFRASKKDRPGKRHLDILAVPMH